MRRHIEKAELIRTVVKAFLSMRDDGDGWIEGRSITDEAHHRDVDLEFVGIVMTFLEMFGIVDVGAYGLDNGLSYRLKTESQLDREIKLKSLLARFGLLFV